MSMSETTHWSKRGRKKHEIKLDNEEETRSCRASYLFLIAVSISFVFFFSVEVELIYNVISFRCTAKWFRYTHTHTHTHTHAFLSQVLFSYRLF